MEVNIDEEKAIIQKYVDSMGKLIDVDINPREDFFKFACGKYNPKSADFSEMIPAICDDICEIIIKKEDISYPSFIKARTFYKSYDKDAKSFLQKSELVAFSGGWPAFDKDWTAEKFDLARTIGLLSAAGFDTILGTTLEYTSSGTIVTVCIENYRYELEFDVDKFLERLLLQINFEKDSIPDIVKDVKLVIKQIDECCLSNKSSSHEQSLEEIKKRSEFNYESFFSTLLGRELNNNDLFILKCQNIEVLEKLFKVLNKIEPRALANYIMVQVAIPYTYYSARNMSFFAPAVIAAGFSTFFTKDDEKKHKEVLQRFSDDIDKYKDQLIPNAVDKAQILLTDEDTILNYKDIHFLQEKVDKEYEELEIVQDNVFQNLSNIGKYEPPESLRQYAFPGNFHDKLIILKIKDFMEQALRTHNKPILSHFVRYGYGLWTTVLKGVTENKDCKDLKQRLCDQIKTHNIQCDDDQDKEFLMKGCINALEGLKFTFKSYCQWLRDNETLAKMQEEILKKINLTNTQAFFVAFAQKDCTQNKEELQTEILCYLNLDELAKEFEKYKK